MSLTSLDPSLWRELSGHLDQALADLTKRHSPVLASKQIGGCHDPASVHRDVERHCEPVSFTFLDGER